MHPFQTLTLRACAMALVLGRRSPSDVRRARFARVVRYCRARGLRGADSSWRVRLGATVLTREFASADRF
jgi:hypothetical protein